MEVITRAEAPKYLRGPYAGKESVAGATSENIAIPVGNDINHKVQNTKVKSCPNKDSTKTQNNHKCLKKNSKNVESETKSEKAKASPELVGPKRGQVV
jgi:hypothetical protein